MRREFMMITATALLPLFFVSFIFFQKGDGNWSVLKTKNEIEGRSECGMASVNGKLYLFGGDGTSSVDVFDPATLTWAKKAAAPIPMNHFQAVGSDHKVYILEAFSEGGFPEQVPMANVYVYDTEKDSWAQSTEIPANRRRAAAGAAAYKGKLYLVAGIQHGHTSGTTNQFDVYDPQTGNWSALPDAPHIRDHCSATVIGDKLYVAGGRNTSYHEADNFMVFMRQTVLEVDCYDFITGKWSTLAAKLPLGSGGGALVNLQNRLYYMGGERATDTEQNAPRKNSWYLDPLSPAPWRATGDLQQARNGMAAAVIGNRIYAFGGAGNGPGTPPPAGLGAGNHAANDSVRRGLGRPVQQGPSPLEVFTLK